MNVSLFASINNLDTLVDASLAEKDMLEDMTQPPHFPPVNCNKRNIGGVYKALDHINV